MTFVDWMLIGLIFVICQYVDRLEDRLNRRIAALEARRS
jgi:hypothetical protein